MTKKEKQNPPKEEEMELEAEELTSETPDDQSDIDALNMQLEALQEKATENLDGWQRSQAEFANYKKRVARDQEQLSEDLKGQIIKRYLEILDDLDRALANKPQDAEGAEWAKGIELVQRKLIAYMEAEGVARMKIENAIFDPNMHEAIAQEASKEHESGEIIEILQPGYLIGNRVLRPAVVKVAE